MLGANTKMIFITAGMGGGTGTGAAPVIAKMAREMDVLVVGIVTIPFQFEGKMRNDQAQAGVDRLRSQVDSLIVINNNKLREVYGNLGFKAGFSKADEVLATASRGIAEVITHHYTQNIDLRDAKTVLSNSGTAIMGSATSSGSNRAHEAITKALDSPLLNDNKITGAKNVLLLIVSGGDEITIDEIGEINDYIQGEAGNSANIIMGVGEDEALAEAISVTVIATGFDHEQQNDIVNVETKKIIHTLEEEQRAEQILLEKKETPSQIQNSIEIPKDDVVSNETIIHSLELEEETPTVVEKPSMDMSSVDATDLLREIPVVYDEVLAVSEEDFEIIDAVDSQAVSKEPELNDAPVLDNTMLSFDMPAIDSPDLFVPKETIKEEVPAEAPVMFRSEEDIMDIEVNDPIEVVATSEEPQAKRYLLEDDTELSNKNDSTKVIKEKVVEEEEIVFETKIVPVAPSKEQSLDEEVDPLNSPISKILVDRAEERKRKMKEFNYKFHNNHTRIDDIEKEPAYKRMGIDLEETPNKEGGLSRTSLSTDENDDIQLRRNNSFLHDNVD